MILDLILDHPRIALRWQLGRILVLNILNFVCLLLSTFEKVHSQTKQLKEIKENLTILYTLELEENKTLDLSNFVTQSIISAVTLTAVVREKRQVEGEGRLYPPISFVRPADRSTTQDPTQFLQTTYYEEQLEGRLIKPKVVDSSRFFENFSIYNNQTERPIDALFTPVKLNVTTRPPPTQLTPSKQPPVGTRVPPRRRPPPKPTSTTTTTTARPRKNVTKASWPPDETAENATELATLIYQIDENTTALIDGTNFTEEETTRKRKWPISTTPPANCSQDDEVTIDPFKLFEFAQKLEREGFQNYTTILKGLWWV